MYLSVNPIFFFNVCSIILIPENINDDGGRRRRRRRNMQSINVPSGSNSTDDRVDVFSPISTFEIDEQIRNAIIPSRANEMLLYRR